MSRPVCSLPHWVALDMLPFCSSDTLLVFARCSIGCSRTSRKELRKRFTRYQQQLDAAGQVIGRSPPPEVALATLDIHPRIARFFFELRHFVHDAFKDIPCVGGSNSVVLGVPGMSWEEANEAQQVHVQWPGQHATRTMVHKTAKSDHFLQFQWHFTTQEAAEDGSAGAAIGLGTVQAPMAQRSPIAQRIGSSEDLCLEDSEGNGFATCCCISFTTFVQLQSHGLGTLLLMIFLDARTGRLLDFYWSLRDNSDPMMARRPSDHSDAVLSSSPDVFHQLVTCDVRKAEKEAPAWPLKLVAPKADFENSTLVHVSMCTPFDFEAATRAALGEDDQAPYEKNSMIVNRQSSALVRKRIETFVHLMTCHESTFTTRQQSEQALARIVNNIESRLLMRVDDAVPLIRATGAPIYTCRRLEESLVTPKGTWTCDGSTAALREADLQELWDLKRGQALQFVTRNWWRGLDRLWVTGAVPIGALLSLL